MAGKSKRESRRELKPKLRFPEFQDVDDWKYDPLEDVAEFVSDRVSIEEVDLSNYVSTENLLPDFAGMTTAAKLPTTGSATRFAVDDVLVSNIRPYLNKVWQSDRDGGASNDVIVIRAKQRLSKDYLSFVLKNDRFISYVMKGAKGVKMPRGDIASMKQYGVAYPEPAEQSKIAGCLSSLDELIGAESRKLEALQAHKKGLMQQLFPREGETLPRLRFPEFKDAPEWVVKPLDQVASYENGKAHEQSISENGSYVVVNSKFISTEGEIRKFSDNAFCLAECGDILMVLSDVPNGRAIAKCFYVDEANRYTVNQRICIIRPTDICGIFLFSVLDRNPFFLAFDDGVKQTNLRKDDVLNCPICCPTDPSEQERIADTISSLDNLIDAQTKRVDAIKSHKKGLMQQLFPAMEDPRA